MIKWGTAWVCAAALGACSRPASEDRGGEKTPAQTASIASAPGASSVPAPPSAPPPRYKATAPGDMVLLKGGRFKMGTDGIGPGTEIAHPASWITMQGFRMDISEVKVSAYQACVSAGACTETTPRDGCSWGLAGAEERPMNCVTWKQADAYCKWAQRELPTEAMWEYAAAGQVGRDFPWGWGVPGRDWGAPHNLDDYTDRDSPKGKTPAGISNMADRLAEWTADLYCPYDNKKCETNMRAVRGGFESMNGYAAWTRHRAAANPDEASPRIGFRCAQVVPGDTQAENAKAP